MMNLYKRLKDREPLTVCSHFDADGCYSAALLSTVFKIKKIHFPWIFGDYSTIIEKEKGETVETLVDVALDLGPPLKDFKGIVIDHHPQTRDFMRSMSPQYDDQIIYDDIPTTGLVYQLFRDKIPDKEKWKVAGGLVGDGQAAKMPIEIWDMFPILLETRGNIYKGTYGKFKDYPYPLYKHLSSPINAMCRNGDPETAYEIICRAKGPMDIITNPALLNDKTAIENEIKNVIKEGLTEQNIGYYTSVVIINSKKRIESGICSALGGMDFSRTWIVANDGNKKFSIRGDLADYLGAKLQAKGFSCGGHSGFWGGELSPEQEGEDITKALREALK